MGAFRWAQTWRKELSSTQLFVLLMIADAFNDKKHYAWPSYSTLADRTQLNRATVIRAVQELRSRGLVDVESRMNAGGDRTSNRFLMPLYDSQEPVDNWAPEEAG